MAGLGDVAGVFVVRLSIILKYEIANGGGLGIGERDFRALGRCFQTHPSFS